MSVERASRRVRILHCLAILICWTCAVVLSGCKDEEIRRYSVEKPQQLDGPTLDKPTDRLLGAIIPRGEQTWFFKVIGRADDLDSEIETFRAFVRSVRFAEGQSTEPTWKLPEGWRQDPPSGMRFATLQFGPEEKSLELTVIALPTAQDNESAYILSNINRWRGQLGLPPISQQQSLKQTESIEMDGATATIVSIAGHSKEGGMARPHFAASPAVEPQPAAQSPPLTFDKPEVWIEGKVGGMRKAAFTVTDDEQTVEITVIDLAEAAGDRLSNINRWRGQVQLDQITQEQLDRQIKKIQVGDNAADYVELVGPEDSQPQQTILGVIAIHSGRAWFIKLKGDARLAENEKQRFESFVKSVTFPSASNDLSVSGADNGQ
jgi:hypothetical protein